MPDYNEIYFQKILTLLQETRGVDFSKYKLPCLLRRIEARMRRVSIPNFRLYLRYIQGNEEEINELIETITINVTSFFRDRPVYDYIEEEIFPSIINKKLLQGVRLIRMWSAGCASGEEAYSLAILFHEIIKRYQVDNPEPRPLMHLSFGVYGTDIDDEILNIARKGIFPPKSVKDVSVEMLEEYFMQVGNYFHIKKDVKKDVHFFHDNLTGEKHFSCFDLIMCRNVMIYFNQNVQTRIIWQFHGALNQNGYLVLGKSESLPREAFTLFRYVSNKERIYQKI